MSDLRAVIGERLAAIQERIEAAARKSGRRSSEVTLVAVIKTHGLDVIQAAYENGLRHIGENRVEEAMSKVAEANTIPLAEVTWHMIGHIQSRKTENVAQTFEWIHSVDRAKIARRLNDSLSTNGRKANALLEVNLSGEETKSGFDVSRWPDGAQEAAFFQEVEEMINLPNLTICGLMTIAPYTDDPEQARPVFQRMAHLREGLAARFQDVDWTQLSMGMSGDYEVAIEEGATMVRIGTALFGARA